MKTFVPKDPGQDRRWLVVDAKGQPLGRLAVKIANALRGKDLPTFTPWVDTGAFVVVVNAKEVKLTGRKETQKIYQDYSGWRSGLKLQTAAQVRAGVHPERLVKDAVEGMLPGNHIARDMMRRLKIYPGAEHPHAAQTPANF